MREYINVKVKRLEKEYSLLNDKEFSRTTELIKEHIAKFKSDGANFIFYGVPEPKTIKDALSCSFEYAIGTVEDVDDDFMYCRILKEYENTISDENMRAKALYITVGKKENRFIKHICRIELKPIDPAILAL